MAIVIQLICWVLFGFIGFKFAEKINNEHDMNFDPRIWAAIGFLFGLIGLAILIGYAYFKIKKKGE